MADYAVAVTIDSAYEPWCGIMLSSLFRQHPQDHFKVYVLSNCKREELPALANFIDQSNHKAIFCHLPDLQLRNAPVSHHISMATYFRLFIPELLPSEVEKVLFLDSDLLICRPLDLLWKTPMGSYSLLAAENPLISKAFKQNLGMQPHFDYFNAGVMMINLQAWREEKITEKALEFLNTSSERITFWDQDVLNFLLQGRWFRLSYQFNAQEVFFLPDFDQKLLGLPIEELELIRQYPRIVHFTGGAKPWLQHTSHPWKAAYHEQWKSSPWASMINSTL